MTDAYPSREDRIVAEFGAGYDVEGIAARHGLTVEQVYALVEHEVGRPGQAPPAYFPPPQAPGHYQPSPPAYYAPPSYHLHGFADPDTIVAEYGDGHDVALIARRHGITVEQVYFIVQHAVSD